MSDYNIDAIAAMKQGITKMEVYAGPEALEEKIAELTKERDNWRSDARKRSLRIAELEAALKEAKDENARLPAALDDKIEIAPDDLLATMLSRAEQAEAEARRLKGILQRIVEKCEPLESDFHSGEQMADWMYATIKDIGRVATAALSAELRPPETRPH